MLLEVEVATAVVGGVDVTGASLVVIILNCVIYLSLFFFFFFF